MDRRLSPDRKQRTVTVLLSDEAAAKRRWIDKGWIITRGRRVDKDHGEVTITVNRPRRIW